MSSEMSTTKENVIWEERNLIETKRKLENNGESDVCDIIIDTKEESEKKILNVITKVSGIYKIINKINGKYYVGSSINIYKRWKEHIKDLNNNRHHSIYLQRSWNKNGSENFKFIIETLKQPKDLLITEQQYLDIAKLEYDKTYNACWNATSIMLGRKHTEETKLKISKSQIGKVVSNDTKRKISKSKIGIKHPYYGKSLSKKHKAKISIGISGNKNPSYNSKIYTFKNIKTNETFIGTCFDFRKKYRLYPKFTTRLINKTFKRPKLWMLVN